jgi:hypothetical protein
MGVVGFYPRNTFTLTNLRKAVMKFQGRMPLFCKSIFVACLFALTSFIPHSAYASFWSLEVAGGAPYNFPIPLTVQQPGEPDINITADYETKPFKAPFYYVIRIGRWEDNKAWEIETIHHKIYLKNTTDEVESFSISHGYNTLTLNRAWLNKKDFIWRIGAGLVLAHPESNIRDQVYCECGGTLNDDGYYIAGPVVMAGLGKRYYLSRNFFVELEGKVTAGYADVNVANNGSAYAPNIAVHANIGLGYDFFK